MGIPGCGSGFGLGTDFIVLAASAVTLVVLAARVYPRVVTWPAPQAMS
jgi:hypothetical protein